MSLINGLDYSMGMPNLAIMKAGNVAFVCRYVGFTAPGLPQDKILTPAEAKTLIANGQAIVSNFEWYNTRPSEGFNAGVADAHTALQIHNSCGGDPFAPIYFSVDYNTSGTDVVDYFKGLISVLGLQRVGAYAGYACIKLLFDQNLITYGWQTYAWSGGQWDNRAHIRQTQNAVQFGGIEVDFDTGMFDYVGQWPYAIVGSEDSLHKDLIAGAAVSFVPPLISGKSRFFASCDFTSNAVLRVAIFHMGSKRWDVLPPITLNSANGPVLIATIGEGSFMDVGNVSVVLESMVGNGCVGIDVIQ